MVSPTLAGFVLSDVKARLSGWVATGKVSVDDMRDLLTFLDVQLEPWVIRGGR